MVASSKPPLALIAGPTASGKSALALALADATGGVIVNADASQLYRDLPILSAAPSAEERERVDHRLFGVIDGADSCSAAEWAGMAKREIERIHDAERLPILVGGTGLYLRTLLDGIAPVPAIDPAVRERVRAATVTNNHAALARFDPAAAARLNPADTTRIARALEVVQSTGRPLADWQAAKGGGIGDAVDLRPLILLPPRDWLYARCDARFDVMIEAGAVDEVESLLARRLAPSLPVMRAIGVRELASFVAKEVDLDAAAAAARQATRNYAKRQYTWFAHQPPASWTRFGTALESQSVIASASEAIQKRGQ